LIVDDHQMLTQSLAMLLAEQPDLEVVGQLRSGVELLAWLPSTAAPLLADIVLLDLHLRAPEGLTLLPQLRRDWPKLRVLVFRTAAGPELIERVATAGAHGFVPKSADAGQLLATIRAVHNGELVFPARPRLATALAGSVAKSEPLLRLQRLSKREKEIVQLICTGLTSRSIADQLSLSELTVATHRRNIMHKLELQSLASLVQFAIDHGL
jgi:DNA-binding NarL/FixJ family response regulator